jgi:hypothetical protein
VRNNNLGNIGGSWEPIWRGEAGRGGEAGDQQKGEGFQTNDINVFYGRKSNIPTDQIFAWVAKGLSGIFSGVVAIPSSL